MPSLSIRTLLGPLLALLLALPAAAAPVALKDGHPDSYTVVKGDTLWDIAGRFLSEPWRWPEVWELNPQIENPNLIYPGDTIQLAWVDGKPRLRVSRGGGQGGSRVGGAVRLTPAMHSSAVADAIPTIPVEILRSFLTRSRVVAEEELEQAPYVVANSDRRVVTGAGDRIFARGIEGDGGRFALFHPNDYYRDPESGEVLGREATFLGDAVVEQGGDPATLRILSSRREVLAGDRLLPIEVEGLERNFQPHPPAVETSGRVIALVDGVSQAGRNQVVAVNLGSAAGMEVGTVLAVHQLGEEVHDPIKGDTIRLPAPRAGLAMVIRPFERVSYALVMESLRPIHLHDRVTQP